MNLQPNKRGVSNVRTEEAGMPSSGSMSAAGGLLPAQRKQEPFADVGQRAPANVAPAPKQGASSMNGTLNGGAVQGAQLKTTPQSMSPGVASYVSIPSFQPNRAQATGTQLPQPLQMKSQGPVFAAANQQPNFGVTPQQANAAPAGTVFGTGLPPQQQAQPAPFAPRQSIADIRDFYDQGGEWDANTRLALQQKMSGDTRAQMLRDALAGRGSNLGQIAQDRANLNTLTAYEAQRGQLQNQAEQDAFAREMQYADTVKQTKMGLMSLASQLGMVVDDADYNKMASELLGSLGELPSAESMLAKLQQASQGKGKARTPQQIASAIGQHIDSFIQNETAAAAYIEQLSAQELKDCVANGACKAKLTKALDDSWGDDYDRIAAALSNAGIPVWED